MLCRGYKVIVVMPFVGHEDDFALMGVSCIQIEVDRRGTNPLRDLSLFWKYYKILLTEKPDLVISYSIKPNIYGGYACTLLKIPYCAHLQGLGTAFQSKFLDFIVSKMYKYALKNAKTVFWENENEIEEFYKRGILKKYQLTFTKGVGVNLDYFSYMSYPYNDQIHFLYLGRIMREKGVNELFNAVERLRLEVGDRFVLDLVGFCEEKFEERIKKLVAGGGVIFHGFQSEPRDFYAQTDCIILPSYHEGMSCVLQEAAAVGRPILTSNIHGCLEAIDDGVSGFLVNARDSEDLYIKMKLFISIGRSERELMGCCGRTKMENEFDRRTVVNIVMNTLDQLGLVNQND